MIFSGAALLLLAAARAFWPSTMPDAREWIARPHAYLVAHYALVGRTIAVAVALAVVLAFLAAEVVTLRHREARIWPHDTLWHLFHRAEPGKVPYVSLKTTADMVFEGPLTSQDSSGDRADRHFVIGPPLKQNKVGDPEVQAPAGWDRVVVGLESVEHMYVRFLPMAAMPSAQQPGPWKAWWATRPRR